MRSLALLGAGTLLVAACTNPPPPQPGGPDFAGGSAAQMGAGHCDAPPKDINELNQWNQLCSPGGRR